MANAAAGLAVQIRPFTLVDAPALLAAALESVDTVGPWFDWCRPGLTLEACEAFIRSRAEVWARDEDYSFVIASGPTGTFLGSVWVNGIDRQNGRGNVGYWVRAGARRHGAATAAVRAAAVFVVTDLRLNRLELVIAAANTASLGVAERVGAVREGVLRQRLRSAGLVHDAVMYSLLASEVRQWGAAPNQPAR